MNRVGVGRGCKYRKGGVEGMRSGIEGLGKVAWAEVGGGEEQDKTDCLVYMILLAFIYNFSPQFKCAHDLLLQPVPLSFP